MIHRAHASHLVSVVSSHISKPVSADDPHVCKGDTLRDSAEVLHDRLSDMRPEVTIDVPRVERRPIRASKRNCKAFACIHCIRTANHEEASRPERIYHLFHEHLYASVQMLKYFEAGHGVTTASLEPRTRGDVTCHDTYTRTPVLSKTSLSGE